jgi:putative flippase GtrA
MSMTDKEPEQPLVKNYITEFLKYAVVGGLAFLVDTGVLVFFKELVFHRQTGDVAIVLSTALGFVAGLIFNFIFSHIFVFKSEEQRRRGKNFFGFVVYGVIGIIGLLLTEAGMLAGTRLVGHEGFYYILVKCFVAGVVLVWNYAARKKFVYKGA